MVEDKADMIPETQDRIDRFEDFNWEEIKTPIKVPIYEKLLMKSGYDAEKIKFLVDGFKQGFRIEYQGPIERKDTADNLPLNGLGSKTDLWNKVMKKVKLGRVTGPLRENELPFTNYVQSPIGLVPKAGGQTRLIFHLSYGFKDSGRKSVNECTPKEKCEVMYNDLDYAIQSCINLLNDNGVDSAIIYFMEKPI